MRITNLGSGSSGNSYIVELTKTSLLIEAGLPYNKMIERLEADRAGVLPQEVFITHEHGDHAKSARKLVELGHNINASPGTLEALDIPEDVPGDIKPMSTDYLYTLEELLVFAFPVEHAAEDPRGFSIRDNITGELLVFAVDISRIDYEFSACTHLMIECNHDLTTISEKIHDIHAERSVGTHYSIQDLRLYLEQVNMPKLQEIYLLHVSESNMKKDNLEEFRNELIENYGIPVKIANKSGGWR